MANVNFPIEYKGVTYKNKKELHNYLTTVIDECTGYATFIYYLKKGKTIDEAIKLRVKHKKHRSHKQRNCYQKLDFFGEKRTLGSIATEYGFPYDTVKNRLNKGESIYQALSHPIDRCKRTYEITENGLVNYRCKQENVFERCGLPDDWLEIPLEKILENCMKREASMPLMRSSLHSFYKNNVLMKRGEK